MKRRQQREEKMTKDREIDIEFSEEEKQPQADVSADDQADAAEPAEGEEAAEDAAPPEPPAEATAEEKVAELEDKLLRTRAEFENYKRRTAQQYEQMARAATDRLLLEVLEVVDNFERALQHTGEQADYASLRQGTELIYNQLTGLLTRYNLEPIEAIGQPFDPNLHEAMMQTPSKDYDEGVVAFEMTKGYKMGDRVLRHSKVGVSTGPPESEDSSD